MTTTLTQPATPNEQGTAPAAREGFHPYIRPFRVGTHAMRFFFATPEAKAWYDPIKPYAQLEYEWITKNIDLAGQTVLDVGSHHGHYALVLAAMQPKKLICVDAVETNCAITEVNLSLNGFDPVIRHCAVTTRTGPVQFTGDTNGRVVDRGVITVHGTRLPTLAPEATIVKLDIEGEEFRVLPDQLDQMPKTHTWIIEIHPWKTRDPYKLLPILEERFDVQWINRATMSVEPYPQDADWSSHATVICRR